MIVIPSIDLHVIGIAVKFYSYKRVLYGKFPVHVYMYPYMGMKYISIITPHIYLPIIDSSSTFYITVTRTDVLMKGEDLSKHSSEGEKGEHLRTESSLETAPLLSISDVLSPRIH